VINRTRAGIVAEAIASMFMPVSILTTLTVIPMAHIGPAMAAPKQARRLILSAA